MTTALELARAAAGSRDVRIAGGADVIQQFLNLDLVDELEIALAPVLFGGGRRLFEKLRDPAPQFRIDRVIDGPAATHLRYVRTRARHTDACCRRGATGGRSLPANMARHE